MWHGYIGIIKPTAWTIQEWRTAVLALAHGLNNSPFNSQPAKRLQLRRRLDDQAVIFEAHFNDDEITPLRVAQKLATILNKTIIQIQTDLSGRFTRFGGVNATWMDSGNDTRTFLQNNAADWEPIS